MELQEQLTKEGQGKDIKEGCVLKTNGYALGCFHVLHAHLPSWNQGKKSKVWLYTTTQRSGDWGRMWASRQKVELESMAGRAHPPACWVLQGQH